MYYIHLRIKCSTLPSSIEGGDYRTNWGKNSLILYLRNQFYMLLCTYVSFSLDLNPLPCVLQHIPSDVCVWLHLSVSMCVSNPTTLYCVALLCTLLLALKTSAQVIIYVVIQKNVFHISSVTWIYSFFFNIWIICTGYLIF